MKESLVARAVRSGAYPALLALPVGASWALLASGTSPGAVVAAVGLALVPVCLGLERRFPAPSS